MKAVAAGIAVCAALVLSPPALGAYRPQLVKTLEGLAFSQGEQDDATARVAIVVPPDYRVSVGQSPGTLVGNAAARVTLRGFDVGAFAVSGRVVAGSAAQYGAAAAACGAASLDAGWVIELSAQGQTFRIPIFVERIGAAVRLLVCFPSPDVPEAQGGAPFGVKLVGAVLSFVPGVLADPQRSGRFVWSGLFTPYVRGSATPGTTVEARAIIPVPGRLTLRAKLVGRRRATAQLSGQLTEAGAHPSGVRVQLYALRSVGSTVTVKPVAAARTRRGGRFAFRRRATRPLWYVAIVQPRPTSCGGSTAPGGCAGAFLAAQTSKVVKVSARLP